ncbi:hypothetical protein KsCSTR_15360 [Candidatus Kuenenia stuttgartiensis]|jgi:hypothetical protein|uniref:Uncharacterized protein n=1 Tax=Kuenenia stuttgartiensis TaxID=174633 RepID=Q1Q1K0_KUEST|nr:hypothetical protein KsCSTR_15360 [Candidatus Kuenenia stuttgartiensis]CAJ73890.1 unknown protein [Candidatus Kuenenia stuttgartiensis]
MMAAVTPDEKHCSTSPPLILVCEMQKFKIPNSITIKFIDGMYYYIRRWKCRYQP